MPQYRTRITSIYNKLYIYMIFKRTHPGTFKFENGNIVVVSIKRAHCCVVRVQPHTPTFPCVGTINFMFLCGPKTGRGTSLPVR